MVTLRNTELSSAVAGNWREIERAVVGRLLFERLVRQVQQRAWTGVPRGSPACPGLQVCPHCRAWLPPANPHGPRPQSQHRARTGQSSLRAAVRHCGGTAKGSRVHDVNNLWTRDLHTHPNCGGSNLLDSCPTRWPTPPWKEVKSVGDSNVTLTPARDRSQGPVRAAPPSGPHG